MMAICSTAQKSGKGSPMLSSIGRSTIKQYACFRDIHSSHQREKPFTKDSSRNYQFISNRKLNTLFKDYSEFSKPSESIQTPIKQCKTNITSTSFFFRSVNRKEKEIVYKFNSCERQK